MNCHPVIRSAGVGVTLTVRSLPRLLVAYGRLPERFSIGSSGQYGFATDSVAVVWPHLSRWIVSTPADPDEVGAGDLKVLDLLQSSSWELQSAGDDQQFTLAIFARSRIIPAFTDEAQMHGHVCRSQTWFADGCRVNIEWALRCAQIDSDGDAADASEAVATYVARALRASALGCGKAQMLGPTSLLPRIVRFVQTHLGSPTLDAEILEGQFGISRAALYRLFQPFGGVSTFIRERRLLRARAILEDRTYANEPIKAVARSCGFKNTTSFNRAYAARFGEPPRALRATTKAPQTRRQADTDLMTLILGLT